MLWYVFALASAFLDATYYTLIKKYLKDIDQYLFSTCVFLICSFILFLIALINGIPKINSGFYSSVFATGSLNIAAAFLYFKALKKTDISLAIPMLSFTPVFLIFMSYFLLDELPSLFGVIGICCIVLGSYIINTKKGEKFLNPFRALSKNKGVLFMLLVAFFYSVAGNFDKKVVLNSDPIFGSAVVFLFVGLTFMTVSLKKSHNKLITLKKNAPKFILAGGVLALVLIMVNTALSLQIVPYVISFKRASILFSVFYGRLIFRERNILRKLFGAVFMLSGVVMILVLA